MMSSENKRKKPWLGLTITCDQQEQDSCWPYAVKKNKEGHWVFELSFSAELTADADDREKIIGQISACTGMPDGNNNETASSGQQFRLGPISVPVSYNMRSITELMQYQNYDREAQSYVDFFLNMLRQTNPPLEIIGETLSQSTPSYCIETQEKYRERMNNKITLFKERLEGKDIDFLCFPSLPNNKEVKKIFNEVMENHGYAFFSSNSKTALWVKKEKQSLYASYEQRHRSVSEPLEKTINQKLKAPSSLHLFRSKKSEESSENTIENTIFAILIPNQKGSADDYVTSLCLLKKELENTAKKLKREKHPTDIIIQNNSNSSVILTSQQVKTLREAGFILKKEINTVKEEKTESSDQNVSDTQSYEIYFSSRDKTIKEVYDKLKEITENYIRTHTNPEEEDEKKDDSSKQDMMQQLLDALTNGNDPDLQMRIHHFEKKLTELLKDSKQMNTINQHRSYAFFRYVGNVFSVLALLIPLSIRMKRNYEQYGLYQVWKSEFWQPESARVFYCAQNELKKLKPK